MEMVAKGFKISQNLLYGCWFRVTPLANHLLETTSLRMLIEAVGRKEQLKAQSWLILFLFLRRIQANLEDNYLQIMAAAYKMAMVHNLQIYMQQYVEVN